MKDLPYLAAFIALLLAIVAVTFIVVHDNQEKRELNQERCLKLIEQGQFLCSQNGSTQR